MPLARRARGVGTCARIFFGVALASGAAAGVVRAADARRAPVSLDFGDTPSPAPTPGPAADPALGRRIAWVRYEPAWLHGVRPTLVPGEILTEQNLSAALQAATAAATRRAERVGLATGLKPLVVTYSYPRYDVGLPGGPDAGAVGVTLRIVSVSVPVGDMGGAALPLARALPPELVSASPFLQNLPIALTATHDRAVGTSVGARTAFALGAAGDAPVRVEADGARSIAEAFHRGDAALRFGRERGSGLLRVASLALEGAMALTPRGAREYETDAWGGSGSVTLALPPGARLTLGVRYARAREGFPDASGTERTTTFNEQGNRIVYEAIPPRLFGFFRAALWEDHLRDAQRLVARVGYSREFPVGLNRSIGVELIGGAGQAWGPLGEPRRFFGGGGQGEFLYEATSSPLLARAPDGPLLRSIGRAQAGLRTASGAVRGGSAFWHANLTLSLPVSRWSRALIPNEETDIPGPGGTSLTLKQILTRQIDQTGPNMLAASLAESDGLTPAEATRRAADVFREIRPAARFIIEQANLLAVKPLLLLDAAELRGPAEGESWLAAGAGLQLTLVTAKLDLGYLHTVRGPTFGSRGNFFARLGFERLF